MIRTTFHPRVSMRRRLNGTLVSIFQKEKEKKRGRNKEGWLDLYLDCKNKTCIKVINKKEKGFFFFVPGKSKMT